MKKDENGGGSWNERENKWSMLHKKDVDVLWNGVGLGGGEKVCRRDSSVVAEKFKYP